MRLALLLALLLPATAHAAIVADAPVTLGSPKAVTSRLELERYRSGGALLAWGTGDAVYTARQTSDGTWADARSLGIQGDDVTLVPGPDGPAAVIADGALTRLAPDGSAIATEPIPGQYPGEGRALSDGTVVISVSGGVVERRPDGTWSPLQDVRAAAFALLPNGLAALTTGIFGPLSLRTRRDDGTWTDPVPFTDVVDDEPQPDALLSDDAGDLAVVWGSVSSHDGHPDRTDVSFRPAGGDWAHLLDQPMTDFPDGALSPEGTLAAFWPGHIWVRHPDGSVDTGASEYPLSGYPFQSPIAVDDAGDVVEIGPDQAVAPNHLVVNAREPGGCFSERRALGAGYAGLAVTLRGDGSGAYAAVSDGRVVAGALRSDPNAKAPACGVLGPLAISVQMRRPAPVRRSRLRRLPVHFTVSSAAKVAVRVRAATRTLTVAGGRHTVRLRVGSVPRRLHHLTETVTATSTADPQLRASRTRTVRIRRE